MITHQCTKKTHAVSSKNNLSQKVACVDKQIQGQVFSTTEQHTDKNEDCLLLLQCLMYVFKLL